MPTKSFFLSCGFSTWVVLKEKKLSGVCGALYTVPCSTVACLVAFLPHKMKEALSSQGKPAKMPPDIA